MRRPTPSRHRREPRRLWLTRFVALVAVMGQLLVAAAAWADAAAEAGGDARPHVEIDGTQLHHAHVESQCALCAAQHLPVGAVASASRAGPQGLAPRVQTPLAVDLPSAGGGGVHLSRAPPTAS